MELPPFAAWRHHDAREGFEVVFLRPEGTGLRVDGHTAAVEAGEGWAVEYAIALDARWRTRRARVRGRSATGAREVVSSFRGINGAPNFSPDGRRLALTLSRSGNPEIYVMDLATKSLKQITNHYGIDTEAVWTADGANLIFTSDRGGKPQLYQVSASGGEASRVSFEGDSNAKGSISFDGKKIAMAQGSGNVYRIAVLDRGLGGEGDWQTLSPGNLDESPSFAPNASMLLYATKEGRRGVLYAVSADGRVRQRLILADGDVREPAWSPYRQR